MYDEKIRSVGNGSVDRLHRCVDRDGAACHWTFVLDLDAIHRARIIGDLARAKHVIQVPRDVVERGIHRGAHALRPRAEWIQAPCGELGAHGVDDTHRRWRDARAKGWIDHQRHHVALRAELEDARLEGARAHLSRDGEQRVRQIDHDARDGDLRRDVVLIRVRADDQRLLRLTRGAKHAESGGVGVLEDDVGVSTYLRERLLASRTDVIPVADVRRQYRDRGIHRFRAASEGGEALSNRRKLGTADHADDVGVGHGAGEHAGEVRRVGEAEHDTGNVGRDAGARGHDVDGSRVIWPNPLRGILELEAVTEDEVVPLRPVLTELLLELGGRLGLDVTDGRTEAIAEAE